MIFRFAHPLALLLLLAPPIILALNARYGWLRATQVGYSYTRLVEPLTGGWRVRLRLIPDILRLAAWLLLVIALARPQSGQSQQVIRGQGVDIALALDISGSMAALDVGPQNRLEAAKSVIADFVRGRDFDRIGLVVFARDAFHHVPPTLDYAVLLRLLGEVDLAPELGLEDGTAIGLGIASAGNMLRSSTTPSRIIILLTDGANNAGGISPLGAAEAVAALGMRVYTIGMGRSGMVTILDEDGEPILIESDLDEESLQAIADISNGRFFRALDLIDLEQVYDQIDRLERSEIERQVFVRWQDQGLGWASAAFILLLIERFLRLTVFRIVP